MTLSEFKAWFEGFTDGMEADAGLSPEQFTKLRQKIAQLHTPPAYEPATTTKPIWIGGAGTPVMFKQGAGEVPQRPWYSVSNSEAN